MAFDMQTTAVAPLLQQALDAHQPYAEAHGVHFRLSHITDDLQVSADVGRLSQVVANLLSNAAKFSHAGSEVVVWAVRQPVEAPGYVRIGVRDQGVGIRDDFRDHIFNKFSQADSAITRQTGGAGLGLYISKQIVEQMSGQIGFDSQPGMGSTFWIDLPDKSASDVSQTAERQAP